MVGFSNIPILMISYELAICQTLPQGIEETLSCGVINMTANVIGFAIITGLTPVLGAGLQKNALWIMICMIAILVLSFVLTLFVRVRQSN
jgi:Na+/melibiose symporter-like transporter